MKKEELIKLFEVKLKSNEKSERTIQTYIDNINRFFDFLEKNNIELENVKPMDIETFRMEENVSKKSKNLMLSAIKSFFDFLVNSMELLEKNPADKVKHLVIKEVDNVEKIPLNKNQVHWLISSCKNIRDKVIVEVLVTTGLRIHELIGITMEDYNYAKNHDGEMNIVGKGNKLRTVYLKNNVMEDIDKYLLVRKDSEYNNLFISNGCKPMDRSCVSRTLKTIARRSGHFTDDEIERLNNHLLRHTFTTEAIEADIPLDIVSKVLGHSSTSTTYKIYLHQSENRIRNAMDNFNI